MEPFDYVTAGMIATWTAAIVAGVRAQVPKIDGPWVMLLTLGAAILASVMLLAAGIPDWLKYALIGWSGAIGGVSFLDRTLDRIKTGGNSG